MKVYFVEKRYANGVWKEVELSPFYRKEEALDHCQEYLYSGETLRILEGERYIYPMK